LIKAFMNLKRFIIQAASAVALILLASASVFAQCAMCKANIANAENAAEVAKIMNTAVLVLLIPAVGIFSLFIGLVLKFRHSQGGEMYEPMLELETRHELQGEISALGGRAQGGEENPRGTD
jgi:heme/copper-type cytochrome/quinol oxidase subunit 2